MICVHLSLTLTGISFILSLVYIFEGSAAQFSNNAHKLFMLSMVFAFEVDIVLLD